MHSDALNALQVFLEYLRAEKRVASNTLLSYQRDLLRLQEYCTGQKIPNWQQLQISEIRQYLAVRYKSGLSGKTIERELAAFRSFYRFLRKKKLVDNDPLQDIRAPKSTKKLPKVLDVDQITGMLDSKPDSILEIRDLAMFELFYSSGLRLSELVMLDLRDISYFDGFIRVRYGKGNKERQVPIGKKALEAIKNWLKHRPDTGSQALFTSVKGTRLVQRSVQLRLEKWSSKNLLPERIHPHMLRHSFASHLLESSQDIRAVQELLGHSNISTTQIYTHLDFQSLANIYDKAHPRSRKKSDSPED
jgi:integrase/recombinase XerC